MMTRSWLGIYLSLLGLVAGCGLPLALPTPATITPGLTSSLPSGTPTLPNHTPTPSPLPLATPTPVPVAATADVVGTVTTANLPQVLQPVLSPDGQWRAEVIVYPCVSVNEAEAYAYEQLNLIHLPSGRVRPADRQLQVCGGLGAFGLKALFWSSDSRYLYYTNAREGVPDGCGYWTPPFLRLDVQSLEIEFLGGGGLSPDGTKLATWQGQQLLLWDLNEGEIGRVEAAFSGFEVGPLAWSPDSQAVVYLQIETFCPLSGASHLVLLELADLKQTSLLDTQEHTFATLVWDTPSELRLMDEQGRGWRYNFETKEISSER